MRKERIRIFLEKRRGILITVLVVGLAFLGLFKLSWQSNIDNMGGVHSWLSGSTIKFVNNWLDDGAINSNLTNYESPASIEFETMDDREPYLSYPSGQTFFVYMAARLTGKQQISISFLHKFQIVMFGIEALLLATFVYYFSRRTLRQKSELESVLIASLTAVLWMILPICSYYLPNIYYADQCVILWVMGLILVEYLFRTSSRKNGWLKLIRALTIYTGMLIDYFFWFLAFMFFVSEILEIWIENKKGKRKKAFLNTICWFGIPALLAVATYYIQLSLTSNWFYIMIDRFNVRVVGEEMSMASMLKSIFGHFSQAFTLDGGLVFGLILMILVTAIGGVVYLLVKKKMRRLILNPGVSIVVFTTLAIISQIYFFKQHSAIHEFSILKVSWLIALLPLLMAAVCFWAFGVKNSQVLKIRKIKISGFFVIFLVCYLLMFIVTGVPMSTNKYSQERLVKVDYSFETMIRDKTNWDDVVFSYTEEIPTLPPQSLAISKKRIYKIDDINSIDEKISNIKGQPKTVLLINKNIKLSGAQNEQQKCLEKEAQVRNEDEKYKLIEVADYSRCLSLGD